MQSDKHSSLLQFVDTFWEFQICDVCHLHGIPPSGTILHYPK